MPWKQTAETEPCEMGSCPILFRAGGGGGGEELPQDPLFSCKVSSIMS